MKMLQMTFDYDRMIWRCEYSRQGAENVISSTRSMNRPAAITWLLRRRPSLQSKRVVVGRRDDDDDDDDHHYARCPDTMTPLCGSDDSQLGRSLALGSLYRSLFLPYSAILSFPPSSRFHPVAAVNAR